MDAYFRGLEDAALAADDYADGMDGDNDEERSARLTAQAIAHLIRETSRVLKASIATGDSR